MIVNIVAPSVLDKLFEPSLRMFADRGIEMHRFRDHASFVSDRDLHSRMDILVALSDLRVGPELMDSAPGLRGIVSPVTGTEGFDQAAASARGILIANGQIEENYTSMAEATVLLILAALYDLKGTERILREGWRRPEKLKARMLMGKTVGLIGFGQIAQAVALRLSAWEARILTTVRTERRLPEYATSVAIEDLLATSDVVVVATSLNEQTRGMLDGTRLRAMREDVVFVNIARGGIVDDDALAALAQERPTMRIALDVYDREPLRSDSPLLEIPDAILTPHMIGHTVETHERLPFVLRDNLADLMEGRVPKYVCNREAIDAWVRRFGQQSD